MDNQKAKFILQSWRAGQADDQDPQFTEALRQAGRDPELAEWFQREQALDATLARKLKQAPVPADLRARLLASRAAEAPAPATARPPLALLALAAALVLLATVAAVWLRPTPSSVNLAAYRQEMQAHVRGPLRFSFVNTNAADLKQWLTRERNLPDFALPAALQNRPGIGCRTWTWNGKPVGLICFRINGTQAVHLFVVDRRAVPDAPSPPARTFSEEGGWTTATWTEGDELYLIVGRGDRASLEMLL